MAEHRNPLRLAIVLAAPFAAALLELWHPRMGLAQLFADGALVERWLAVHVLQLFSFALVALAGVLLVARIENLAGALTRLSLGGFAVFYGAYDALAGISTGLLLAFGRAQPTGQQGLALGLAQEMFVTVESGSFAWLGLLGAFLWMFGLLAAGIALAGSRWPRLALGLAALAALLSTFGNELVWGPLGVIGAGVTGLALLATAIGRRISLVPVGLLGVAALFLTSGHPAPFGTIAFGSLFLAALWLSLTPVHLPGYGPALDTGRTRDRMSPSEH